MSIYSDLILSDTPASYWRLNETSGSVANRLAGPLNGSYSGVTLNQTGLLVCEPSAPSVYFNGTSAYISTGGQCGVTTYPVSIEFWIKPQANVIGLFDSSPGNMYVLRNYGNNNFEWWNGDPNLGFTLTNGQTYHIVVCFYYSGSSRRIRLYRNGSQVSDVAGSSDSNCSITGWRFGDINNGGAGRYTGYMQELALYSRLLTLSEVQDHYNQGITPQNMLYRCADLPIGSDPQIARYFSLPLAPSGALYGDVHERGVVQDSGSGNWSYNRIFPIVSMGEPTALTDWGSVAPTGGAVSGSAVSADGYVFWTRENRYIDKVDPNNGTVVATRDFGAGSKLAAYLCAKDVKGVAHIYCTTAYDSANALLRAIKTTDLTDYWTQAWTSCPATGIYPQYVKVFDTLSGVLIVETDTGPNYYWRCIRDNGATATYLWASTLATSGGKTCVTNGDDIWGVYYGGGMVQAVKTADGTHAHYANQANIVSGTAQVLCHGGGFGVAIIGPSAPYKLRRFQLSDGVTPADYPPDLQMPSGSVLYPIVDQERLIYFNDATKVYCYDEWFNLNWTYTHPRTIVAFWMDLERNLYVLDQLELRCIQNEDHSTTRWSQPLLVPGLYTPISVSDTRIVLYNATYMQGIWITKNPQQEYVDTFTRADAASLGADWTDDYFFADTGAHDFWSIESNKARITPTGSATQAGAVCLAAKPTRDIDLRMTCTVGVAPTGGQASVGLAFRGIDGRTFCTFIYDAADSGNFKYLWQDNFAAGQTTAVFSANRPTIANGGEIKLRVVLHRQTGYYWMNGQGPYEIGTGFLGEQLVGMFAGRNAGSARVSEFRVTGKSNNPYHQQMAVVGRGTEVAGYEYRGVGALTRQIFRAADGRVMAIWHTMYAGGSATQFRNYWAQTAAADDITSWQSPTIINTSDSVGTWSGEQVNGWQDAATDNVYAIFMSWGSGGQRSYFVKFTKVAGGGWTAGSPVVVASGLASLTDNMAICKVPGTGRLWYAQPSWQSIMNMFYSDDDGATWNQIASPCTSLNVSGTPCSLHAWDSNVILIYKNTAAGNPICSILRDDTLANKQTWGSEVLLYGSQSSSEGWHHSLWLVPSNVASAKFVLVLRLYDGTLRAKRYTTAWVGGDCTLAQNQRVGSYNRSWWDGTRRVVVVCHASVNMPPIWYDPATHTKVQGHHDAPYYGSSSAPTGCRHSYSLVKRGFANGGTWGVIAVRSTIDNLYLARPQTSPFDILEGRQPLVVVPWETTIQAGFSVGHDLPLAWDGSLAYGTVTLPFEYLVHPLFSVFHDLPLEILAGQALTVHRVPWESAATLLQGSKTILTDWRTILQGRKGVPLDAWGIWQAILHKWYAYRKDRGELLHLWQALQKAKVGSLPHEWTVLTEQDPDFPHLWRVIEPKLVALHGEDIQLPFGTIEKVD